MKKINVIITAFICCFSHVKAQESVSKRFEWEISSIAGISGLSSSTENGTIKPETGFQFGVSGKYFFNPTLGVGLGVGYLTTTSAAELENYKSSVSAVDDELESFEYRTTATGIKEKLQLSALEIPMFVAIRPSDASRVGLYANAGFKISLPLKTTYQCSDGYLKTTGYYEKYNVEFSDMPNHGFETINTISYSGDLTANMVYSLFGDVGISIPFGKKSVNIGLYGSYGLNSVLKSENQQLVSYPSKYNSMTSLANKVSLMSVGVKLGVSF